MFNFENFKLVTLCGIESISNSLQHSWKNWTVYDRKKRSLNQIWKYLKLNLRHVINDELIFGTALKKHVWKTQFFNKFMFEKILSQINRVKMIL